MRIHASIRIHVLWTSVRADERFAELVDGELHGGVALEKECKPFSSRLLQWFSIEPNILVGALDIRHQLAADRAAPAPLHRDGGRLALGAAFGVKDMTTCSHHDLHEEIKGWTKVKQGVLIP